MMRDGAVAVQAILIGNRVKAVIAAPVLLTCEGGDHLVHQVVDVEQFQFHRRVVDPDRKVVCDVVAECRHGGVVVRPAPLAEEVGEAVDEHSCPRGGRVHEEQVLARLLASAVLAVPETAGEGCLYGGREHHGAGVAVLSKRVEEG